MRFRKHRKPELGDKACSRHGQKGVIGMVLPEASMPMTKDGIIPDIIINPHALPSRMTIAHLVECIFAKGCCFDGAQGDGTMFIPVDYDTIGATLEEQGFNRHGNEIMYDGRTGRQIGADVFIGPTFYYRLKHMVSDKVHARPGYPEGLPRPDLPYDHLTRQPTEGRARNGGLRVGEMERDVLVSYGMSQFTKESMMDRSDRYRYGVCRHCGIIATPGRNRRVFACPSCGSTDASIVETPYSWKLLVQEFEALGVEMRYVMGDVPHDDGDGSIEGYDSDAIPEQEEEAEEEEDYQHNQDLDEPAVYGTEEHIQYGGLSEEIVDKEPAIPSEPFVQQEQGVMDPIVDDSPIAQEQKTEVKNEPPLPPVAMQEQKPAPPVLQSGGGDQNTPELDLNDSDFFMEDIPRGDPTIQTGGDVKPLASDIKTIVLSNNALRYKPSSVPKGDDAGDEYGGDYQDESGGLE